MPGQAAPLISCPVKGMCVIQREKKLNKKMKKKDLYGVVRQSLEVSRFFQKCKILQIFEFL